MGSIPQGNTVHPLSLGSLAFKAKPNGPARERALTSGVWILLSELRRYQLRMLGKALSALDLRIPSVAPVWQERASLCSWSKILLLPNSLGGWGGEGGETHSCMYSLPTQKWLTHQWDPFLEFPLLTCTIQITMNKKKERVIHNFLKRNSVLLDILFFGKLALITPTRKLCLVYIVPTQWAESEPQTRSLAFSINEWVPLGK